jgi:hypothetical protein
MTRDESVDDVHALDEVGLFAVGVWRGYSQIN